MKLAPLRISAAGAAAALWSASLLLPAVQPRADEVYHGSMILMIGWLGVFALQFGWFANILIIFGIALLLVRECGRRLPRLVGGGLLVLCVNALFWREMYYSNETRPIETYHLGYYLWFAANVIAAFALFARAHFEEEQK